MPYRPLTHNEYAIVARTLYDVRGLNDGFAQSLLMAYKAKALHEDVPEFDVFTVSEHERLESPGIDSAKMKGLEGKDFFDALDKAISESTMESAKIPENTFVWLFGDESLLDAKHKRLRVLFFNSARYRQQALNYYVEEKIIINTNDLDHIHTRLKKFSETFPGKRQGVISHYELYFGNPSLFSYEQVKRRKEFLTNSEARATYLDYYNLPKHWTLQEIRQYQLNSALESRSLTTQQIEEWDSKDHYDLDAIQV